MSNPHAVAGGPEEAPPAGGWGDLRPHVTFLGPQTSAPRCCFAAVGLEQQSLQQLLARGGFRGSPRAARLPPTKLRSSTHYSSSEMDLFK